ncbi:MAG TPA: GAF domain-containing protein [Anaerolineae bacterium]|nr:GAF domain-containing protein [Anaerolineae bacterium]
MAEQNNRLDDSGELVQLQQLHQEMRQASDFEQVVNFVEAYLGGRLLCDEVLVTRSVSGIDDEQGQISYTLGESAWHLVVRREEAFNHAEKSLLQLVSSLMATVPTFPRSVMPTSPLPFLELVGQKLGGTPSLPDVLATMEEEFGAYFPEIQVEIWLLDRGSGWQLRAVAPLEDNDDSSGKPDMSQWEQVVEGDEPFILFHTNNDGTANEILFPLKGVEHNYGLLRAIYVGERVPSRADRNALTLLTNYVGMALHQDELTKLTFQRARHLETIFRVTESARSLQLLEPTLAEIHAQLAAAFQTSTCYLALLDEKGEQIHFPYATSSGDVIELTPIKIDDPTSLTAWVVRQKKSYVTGGWVKDPAPVPGISAGSNVVQAIICVPLLIQDKVLGAVAIQSEDPDAFDERDYQLLETISDHVAIIIDNAHLYSETQASMEAISQHHQTAVTLNKAITAVNASLDLQEVLDQLLTALSEVVPCDVASIALIDDNQPVLSAFYHQPDSKLTADMAQGIIIDSYFVRQVVETQKMVVLDDVRVESDWVRREAGPQVLSWIGAPLLVQDEVVGVLMVDSMEAQTYGLREQDIVFALASQAAVAVHNASLHEEVQRQLTELTIMYQATAMMTAELNEQAVLETVAREMVRALAADVCTVFIWQKGRDRLRPVATYAAEAHKQYGVMRLSQLESFEPLRTAFDLQQVYELGSGEISTEERKWLTKMGLGTALAITLHWRGESIGLLMIGQEAERYQFKRQERKLALNLAGQAAVALEHARSYTKAQRRIQELSTFHDISLRINALHDINDVLDTLTESALELVDVNNIHIYLYNEQNDEFTIGAALWRDGRKTPATTGPRKEGITATAARKREPIIINDAHNHELFRSGQALSWGIEAIAAFPLIYNNEVIGVLTATYVTPHHFNQDEILLLRLLSDQTAVAVENVHLLGEVQRRLAALSGLFDLAQQVMAHLDLQAVMNTTVALLQGFLKARATSIVVLHENDELVVEAAVGIEKRFHQVSMKVGEGASGRAVQERRPIYIRDTQADPNFVLFDTRVRSLLSVPLMARDEVLGAMAVDSDRPNAFDESDIQFMTVAATQVSTALANARLYEEVQTRAEKLAVAYEELKENDRLKDELIQNVSHELRTPLTFVKGYVDLLLDGAMGNLRDDQKNALRIVSTKTDEVTRLVSDIFTLHEENLKMEPLELRDLVRAIVADYKVRDQLNDIEPRVIGHLPELGNTLIEGDKGRLTQVLGNLLDNALKFSPEGGTVAVHLMIRDESNDCLIEVRDEGIGIPKEKLPRIFDRFYQVDGKSTRRFGGAGIGLALVRKLVEAHGGTIWVDSEENVGSTFSFTIPLLDNEANSQSDNKTQD